MLESSNVASIETEKVTSSISALFFCYVVAKLLKPTEFAFSSLGFSSLHMLLVWSMCFLNLHINVFFNLLGNLLIELVFSSISFANQFFLLLWIKASASPLIYLSMLIMTWLLPINWFGREWISIFFFLTFLCVSFSFISFAFPFFLFSFSYLFASWNHICNIIAWISVSVSKNIYIIHLEWIQIWCQLRLLCDSHRKWFFNVGRESDI